VPNGVPATSLSIDRGHRGWKNGSTGAETQQQYFTLMKAKVTVPLRKLVQTQSLFQKVK
jgi:hypothetical protein